MNVAGFSSNRINILALTVEVELPLSALDLIEVVKVPLSCQDGVSVTVLLLVLPNRETRVAVVYVLVLLLIHGKRWVRTDILAECLFDNSLNCELLTWLNEHLSRTSAVLNELEKWVICQGNTPLYCYS
jgi:hypothetical protein